MNRLNLIFIDIIINNISLLHMFIKKIDKNSSYD